MSKELLMAVDLGTSFIKAGVFDLVGNEIVVTKEPVKSEEPGPGQFIQRGEDLISAVLNCMKNASEALGDRSGNIAVIGFTGQMAGFMGVDRNWNDVTGWSCSLDTRYVPFAERQMKQYAEQFYNISGTNSPLFSSKYEWFRTEYPTEAQRIAKYLMISGYVIGKLGDISIDEAVIDGSLITWTGLADVCRRTWSPVLCKELHIPEELLPKIVESSDVAAHLSAEAAKATGLTSGIPLVSGAGDKIAGCVGTGNLLPGEMLFEAASFGAVSCMVKEFRSDKEARGFDLLNGSEEGTLFAHYYMPGSGITQNWYIRNFCRQTGESLDSAYDRLDKAILQIEPGSDGLFACGMFGGTVMPFNGDIRGAFIGHTWSHTPAHFYRALIESFAYSLSLSVSRINAMYPEYKDRKKIRMIGGGAASSVNAQIYADVLGIPIETLQAENPALWGACLLGGQGIHLIHDLTAYSKAHIKVCNRFEPDFVRTEKYVPLISRYKEFVEKLTPMCAQLQNKNHS